MKILLSKFILILNLVPNIGDTITSLEFLLAYCSDLQKNEDASQKGDYLRAIKKALVFCICEQLFGEAVNKNGEVVRSRVPKRPGGVEKSALFVQWGRRKLTLFQGVKALSKSNDDFLMESARFIQVNKIILKFTK